MKLTKFRLEEINTIERLDIGETTVYDISVKDDESYLANGIIVHNCTTSANTGIHYPMASLINECAEKKLLFNYDTKIVADGGFKRFDDIIKAIALGADYVMIGGILSKTLEACSKNYRETNMGEYEEIKAVDAYVNYISKQKIYKKYRGMSTKEVQKKWNKGKLKTAEGITYYTLVEYRLDGWVENFRDYLKSNMSYCGKRTLEEYRNKVDFIFITDSAQKRYMK